MDTRKTILLTVLFFIALCSTAQVKLWSDAVPGAAGSYADPLKMLLPAHYRLVVLNRQEAARLQQQVQQGGYPQPPLAAGLPFDLPLPDGSSIHTLMYDAPLLSPELQQAYPEIKTYQLINPRNHNQVARLTHTDMGMSGIIFTDTGTAYINPLGPKYPGVHMVYFIKDLKTANPLDCRVKQDLSNLRPMGVQAGDGKKRTFRLAVAATGEYTIWAGSQANALSYITTTINNVTAIYERDNTISFTLVSNNSILFTDSLADPYPTVPRPDANTLSANQNTLKTNIGINNFDLGIVFNNGWNGGLASVGVVCNNTYKGQGAAGLNFGIGANATAGPQGPIFDGTVAHEIGHEFSATHSFAASNGGCSGNTTAATAYEPGGGSTIMAYAGVCTGNAYQNHSDLYFHAGSIAQIQSYVTGGSASCVTPVTTSNHAPTVTVPATTYTIPASTPFTLNSTGSDIDGNTLKYAWEQMDAGIVTSSAPQSTNTGGPNFRSYVPSLNSARTFPQLSDIIAGNSPPYEVLSSIARTLNFRVTVRDEAAGGGATGEANVAVNVDGSSGPFTVTSQNSATSWTANGTNTAVITWNVANTNASPVNCSAVDILFSIDGGFTYPYTLASNIPNNGSQTITIPSLPTSIGRIKVQSRNNAFFNINTADISISSACAAEGASFSPSSNITASSGSPSLHLALSPAYGTVVTPSGQLTSSAPVSSLVVVDSISRGPRQFDNLYRYNTFNFTVNQAGNYTLTLSGTFAIIMNLYGHSFDSANPSSNFITSNGLYGNATGTVYISSRFTAALTPGRSYTLALGTFSANQPALPASYSVAVTAAPAGGNLYTAIQNPGTSFNYTYVIVDNATGLIKAIDPNSDLSNSSTYPSGSFTVYGLSYSNSIPASTLNAYIGGSFNALSQDLLYKPATVCGNLSTNLMQATITAALPVKLLPLTASRTGSTALLKWGTASEQNNDYFEIQRSGNGISFSKIGNLPPASNGSTNTYYSFPDPNPETGLNYYRVKQVDKDGSYTYTNIATVDFNQKNISLSIYPSPASAALTVEYYAETPASVQWMIVDSKGALLQQAVFAAMAGRNLLHLDVSGLAAGVYLLKTVSHNAVLTSRFIKD